MNRQRKILFRIIFLLAVLFCFEMNGYSSFMIQAESIERVAGTDKMSKVIISDVDFFDDEQVNQFFEFYAVVDPGYQVSSLQNCILILNYPASIWQPPKYQYKR